jgi:hypothetical protein
MKEFADIKFDRAQCRFELDQFQSLLDGKEGLAERGDLQMFFKQNRQLTAFIGSNFAGIGPATQLAYEFSIFGDHSADLVIGNAEQQCFCAIELEDALPNSVFKKRKSKTTREWGRRFEHGFSQLVDWFFAFDDHKNTAAFANRFGHGHVEFSGLLVIGRSGGMSDYERKRLRWRSDRVSVNTHKLVCRTYDELRNDLEKYWRAISIT